VHRAPADFPAGKEGDVLTVDFTAAGIQCIGLNGGSAFTHSEAFSFQIATDDQEGTDRLWNALVSNEGQESVCGCIDPDRREHGPASVVISRDDLVLLQLAGAQILRCVDWSKRSGLRCRLVQHLSPAHIPGSMNGIHARFCNGQQYLDGRAAGGMSRKIRQIRRASGRCHGARKYERAD